MGLHTRQSQGRFSDCGGEFGTVGTQLAHCRGPYLLRLGFNGIVTDPAAKSWDRGKIARRKAKIAVARKLAVKLHYLWKTGEEYRPLLKKKGQAKAA